MSSGAIFEPRMRRRRASRKPRPSAQWFHALIENAVDLVAVVDREGTIQYVSPSHTRTLGYEPNYLIGRKLLGFVHPEDRRQLIQVAARLLEESGSSAHLEYRLRHQQGSWRTLEGLGKNLVDDPVIGGFVLNTRDVSDRKEAEANLARALRERENIMESIPDVLYTLDLEGRLINWNRKLEEVTGLAGAELEGRSALEFFPDEERLQVGAAIGAAFSAGYGEVEALMRAHGERLVPYHFTGVPLRDKANHIIGMTGVGRDITDRRRAEEAQRDETRIAAALARVGQTLIAALDTPALLDRLCQCTAEVLECDFSHTWLWNEHEQAYGAVSTYGDPPEHRESIHALKLPRAFMVPLLERFERGEIVNEQIASLLGPQPGQQPAIYGVSVGLMVPLRRGGEVFGMHTAGFRGRQERFTPQQERIARGIAQLASLALENARLVEQLEDASRLKSEFVATMSHELRTPLNVISGYVELLLDGTFGGLSDEQKACLTRVRASSQELCDLVNATLDLSRLENGRLPLEVGEVRIGELMHQIEGETREILRPGLDFVWHVPPTLPCLRTDVMKLRVVLKNLINNALKFTETGAVTIHVSVASGGIEFAVSDTGIGMASDTLAIIFEPFRQGDSSFTRQYGGVGLGLYIARRLTDVLGGNIAVESELGHGSTFRVWLPVASAQPYGSPSEL